MADALKARGYDTLMVLPAQTQVVELVEVNGGGTGDAPVDYEQLFDEAHALFIRTAQLLAECTETLTRVATFLQGSKEPGAQPIQAAVVGLAARVAAAYVAKG
jgi:hypothetical protein